MNKVYEIYSHHNSDNGIYEAFYKEVVAPTLSNKNMAIELSEELKKLQKTLTGAVTKRLAIVTGAALSIIGIVGVAGSIQHERISLPLGITIAALCLGAEFLCLKMLEAKSK